MKYKHPLILYYRKKFVLILISRPYSGLPKCSEGPRHKPYNYVLLYMWKQSRIDLVIHLGTQEGRTRDRSDRYSVTKEVQHKRY